MLISDQVVNSMEDSVAQCILNYEEKVMENENENRGNDQMIQESANSFINEVYYNSEVELCNFYHTRKTIIEEAENGFYKRVRKLLEVENLQKLFEPVNQETVLISLIRSLLDKDIDTNHVSDDGECECDHYECLKYILEKMSQTPWNVNYRDAQGNTALQYAVRLDNAQIMLLLLKAGAYVCNKNNAGEILLQSISHSILEEYLDDCISIEKRHKVILDCQIFQVPEDQPQISEIEPLCVMNDTPELRDLLNHPVLNSFLHMKWQRVEIYYYFNISIYLIFCLAVGFYASWVLDDPCGKNDNHTTAKLMTDTATNTSPINLNVTNFTSVGSLINHISTLTPAVTQSKNGTGDFINNTIDEKMSPLPTICSCRVIFILSNVITLLLCIYLALRELLQMIVSIPKYFSSLENWLVMFLIVVTAHLLWYHENVQWNRLLAAAAVLVAGFEFIFLIGRHPSLSTNMEIFKTVTFNFLKFLGCYSILILAFALSFCILCYDKNAPNDFPILLGNISSTIMSTFITLTQPGTGTNFADKEGYLQVLSVLNVFFITIVLRSLLGGLAINDIHSIKQNARLLGIVSRIKCIWYIDSASTINIFPTIRLVKGFVYFCCCCYWCCCGKQYCNPKSNNEEQNRFKYIKILPIKTNLFQDLRPSGKIHILPDSSAGSALSSHNLRMDRHIMNQAKKILEKRKITDEKRLSKRMVPGDNLSTADTEEMNQDDQKRFEREFLGGVRPENAE